MTLFKKIGFLVELTFRSPEYQDYIGSKHQDLEISTWAKEYV